MADAELASLLLYFRNLTGSDFSGRTFSSRLRIQKTIYFLQRFNHPWTREYSFGEYFHGPYSPALAADYYALAARTLRHTPSQQIEVPKNATDFVKEALGHGNPFLETAATLDIFLNRNPTSTTTDATRHLRWLKPQLSSFADEAITFLRKYRMIPGAT